MRWRDIGNTACPVARALSVVGDRWTLLILREVFLGARRFDVIQSHVGATRHLLADRLRKLVEHELLIKVRYQEHPVRFEYRLTDKGLDLYPVIASLQGWGSRWMMAGTEAPVSLVHKPCGREMLPSLCCPSCGELLSAWDIEARPSEDRIGSGPEH